MFGVYKYFYISLDRAYELYNCYLLRLLVSLFGWGMLLLTVMEDPALPSMALPYWVTTNKPIICVRSDYLSSKTGETSSR